MKNMSYVVKAVFCLMAITAIEFPAYAGNRGEVPRSIKKHYLRADVGYSYIPYKLSSRYAAKPKGALLGTVGVGYIICPKFRADITATYRGKYKYSSSDTRQDIYSTAFMLNGYWHLKEIYKTHSKNFQSISPYITAGVGYGINNAGDIKEPDMLLIGAKKENFVWQVGVGSWFKINEYIAADLMYKYVDLGDVRASDFGILPPNVIQEDDPYKGKLRGHELSIGINFKI